MLNKEQELVDLWNGEQGDTSLSEMWKEHIKRYHDSEGTIKAGDAVTDEDVRLLNTIKFSQSYVKYMIMNHDWSDKPEADREKFTLFDNMVETGGIGKSSISNFSFSSCTTQH